MQQQAHTTAPSHPSLSAQATIAKVRDGLETQVVEALKKRDMTNSELSAHICHNPRGVQPRTSELKERGLIFDTGGRRQNAWGNNEIVWSLKKPTSNH